MEKDERSAVPHGWPPASFRRIQLQANAATCGSTSGSSRPHIATAPAIRSGKRVLVAAHGNSMRALVKYLDGISDQDIVGLNIPNGIPLVYELDAQLKPLRHYYLGDAEAAARAAAAVAGQGKA